MIRFSRPTTIALMLAAILPATSAFAGGRGRAGNRGGPGSLQLDQGTLDFDTPEFNLKLVKSSQTISALQPKRRPRATTTPPSTSPLLTSSTPAPRTASTILAISPSASSRPAAEAAWIDITSSGTRKPVEKRRRLQSPRQATNSSPPLISPPSISGTRRRRRWRPRRW